MTVKRIDIQHFPLICQVFVYHQIHLSVPLQPTTQGCYVSCIFNGDELCKVRFFWRWIKMMNSKRYLCWAFCYSMLQRLCCKKVTKDTRVKYYMLMIGKSWMKPWIDWLTHLLHEKTTLNPKVKQLHQQLNRDVLKNSEFSKSYHDKSLFYI